FPTRRSSDLSDHFVDACSELCSLAIAQPADPGGQSLELDVLLSLLYPSPKVHVVWKSIKDELVYLPDVFWVPDERRPPERTPTFTEHWSDVLLNESREFECFLQTGVKGLLSNVVAILEYNSSLATHIDHGFDIDHNHFASPVEVLGRVGFSQLVSFFLRQSRRIVSFFRFIG